LRIGRLAELPLAVVAGIAFDVLPPCVQGALGVEEAELGGVAAVREDEPRDRRVGGPRAKQDDPGVAELLARQLERVDQARQGHAGGALGVVVPHRYVACLPQLVQDPEAVGLRDVLEVDRAEGVLDHLHELDDLGRVVLAVLAARVHAEGDRVHAAQVLHQEGLALHDPEASGRRAVAVAQDPRRVRDDTDEVAPVGQGEGQVVVVADARRHGGDAWRVPDIEPVEAPQAAHRHGLHLAAEELVRRKGETLEEDGLRLRPLFGREVRRKGVREVLEA
jgi:hypothetical protein